MRTPAVARARGLDVFCGTLEEYQTDQQYDVVFMSHVIEHVLDPVATVATIERLLAPGGVLYLETPNVGSLDARVWKQRWGLIHYPRHLYLFDRDTDHPAAGRRASPHHRGRALGAQQLRLGALGAVGLRRRGHRPFTERPDRGTTPCC